MFERFTENARQALVTAQAEARAFGHQNIDTEHLLIALSEDNIGTIARRTLDGLGVTSAKVRVGIKELLGTRSSEPEGLIPFTPRAKKMLEFALRESLRLQEPFIDTYHLLLALTDQPDGAAAAIVCGKWCEVNLDALRKHVLYHVTARNLGLGPGSVLVEVAPPYRPAIAQFIDAHTNGGPFSAESAAAIAELFHAVLAKLDFPYGA